MMSRKFWLGLAAAPLLLAHAASAAPKAEDRHSLPDLTVHDFAAKYLMQTGDLADLRVYAKANDELIASADRRPRVVLLGDSITFHWKPEALPAPKRLNVVNRGVVGQNTDQMLLRFEDDVVALHPAAVVIAGGSNDLRVFVGEPAAARAAVLARLARNYRAMADIAQANHIQVVLAAITPCRGCAALNRDPATLLVANAWLRDFAAQRGFGFVDYYGALAGADGELPADITTDGLHVTDAGYVRMWGQLGPALERLRLPHD